MAWDFLDDTLLGNSGETSDAALRNPVTAFNFVLEVELVYYLALKSVHVFNKENEYEYIREGGVNDYVHMRRKPISKPFTFQVERYVSNERFMDPLANGTELALPVVLYVYRHKTRSGLTESAPAWPARIYTFTGCVVTAKEYGELNAEKSGLLTETTTIAYRELMVVTNPTWGPEQDQPAWKFPHDEKDHIFPANKYANAGSTSQDKNIYVKKEDAALDGMPVWQRNDEAYSFDGEYNSTNKPFWSIRGDKGHTTLYADQRSALWAMGSYEEGVNGLERVDSEAKKRLDSYEIGTEVLWADGKNMNAGKHYSRQDDGSWKMNDDEAKLPWSMQDNKTDPKTAHAVPAKNGDKKAPAKEPISKYEDAMPKYADSRNVQSPDNYSVITEDGVSRTVYVGGDERFDKPPYSEFLEGDLPIWANATNAVSDEHYTPAPGDGGWVSTDEDAKLREKEYKEAKPKWADATNAVSGDHYSPKPGDGGWESKDPSAKPVEKEYKDAKPKWANDTNAVSGDHYTPKPGEGGWESKDPSAKPKEKEYSGSKPKWADSTNAVSDEHYSPKPGEGGWEVSDGTGKPRWNIKDNKTDPKPANAVPSPNGDGKQPPKEPWDIKSNRENPKPKYAEPSRNGDGKQPPKGPWDIKANTDGPRPSFAVPSPNGDGLQPAKGPWDIKANTENPKAEFAVPATNGDGKQPAREPWDIKANVENPLPKYATESPKDHEKPEAVKWPPTRRALMADSLSKK